MILGTSRAVRVFAYPEPVDLRKGYPESLTTPMGRASRVQYYGGVLTELIEPSGRKRPAMDGLSVGSQTDTLSADGTFKERAGFLDGVGRRGASEH